MDANGEPGRTFPLACPPLMSSSSPRLSPSRERKHAGEMPAGQGEAAAVAKSQSGMVEIRAQCLVVVEREVVVTPPVPEWRTVDPKPKVDITFRRLGFTARTKKGGRIEILQDATGFCRGGRLLAIAGPSGAGKSTLLKILSCNIGGGEVHGTIYFNGNPIELQSFRKCSTVVWQRDILLPTSTVREAIMTSALLRLPQKIPFSEKKRRVEGILDELELQHRADTLIGEDIDGTVASISGGERRRVSVGIGLVTDPRVIFLDEPTTGLDSDSALTLMKVLKQLAQRGRTVVCTIHQPSSDICEMFDDFMLMADGRVLYCGEWALADEPFVELGFERPKYRSLAEHLLNICKDKESSKLAADCYAKRCDVVASRTESAAVSDIESACSSAIDIRWQAAASVSRSISMQLRTATANCDIATTRLFQLQVLGLRFMRTWIRSPVNLLVQLAQYMAFAFLIGATYFKIGHVAPGGSFDRVASLWFVCACMVLQPAPNACSIYSQQRDLLRRELSNRMYNFSAYFIAKSITSLPFQLLFTTVFAFVVYFMVGYQLEAIKFAVFFVSLLMLNLVSETIGIICASLNRDAVVGNIYTSGVCLLLLMFTGFVQTRTPAYLMWLKKVSYVAFAYRAIVKNEFDGLRLTDQSGAAIRGIDAIPANIQTNLPVWQDLVILLCILLGMRVLTYGLIRFIILRRWL